MVIFYWFICFVLSVFWNDGGEGVILLSVRGCCDNSKKCYKSTAFFAEMQENCDFI